MDNPSILLNPEILRKGAKIVNETNKLVADIIGINPAARTTCVKPSGNASVLLQTSSGIHPAHSHRYFRIMQMNKGSEMASFLEKDNQYCLKTLYGVLLVTILLFISQLKRQKRL
jgi:ribonucleoside-diphosphate reductase alpha chain